jgi:hypothetical protein
MENPETVNSAGDDRVVNNVVRHEYRKLSDEEKAHMTAIKDAGAALIAAIQAAGAGREYSLGITKAEEAVMWSVKGLTQ